MRRAQQNVCTSQSLGVRYSATSRGVANPQHRWVYISSGSRIRWDGLLCGGSLTGGSREEEVHHSWDRDRVQLCW